MSYTDSLRLQHQGMAQLSSYSHSVLSEHGNVVVFYRQSMQSMNSSQALLFRSHLDLYLIH